MVIGQGNKRRGMLRLYGENAEAVVKNRMLNQFVVGFGEFVLPRLTLIASSQ